jgi:hypothetical protein
VLARGPSENRHELKEPGHLSSRGEGDLGVVSELAGGDTDGGVGAAQGDADATLLQPAQKAVGDEEVQEWRKGAALADAGVEAHHPGEVAIDRRHCAGVGQQQLHPGQEAGPNPHPFHDRE